MVGATGIEPVTFAMSTQRSPAELRARFGTPCHHVGRNPQHSKAVAAAERYDVNIRPLPEQGGKPGFSQVGSGFLRPHVPQPFPFSGSPNQRELCSGVFP